MPRQRNDLTGQRFGKRVVLGAEKVASNKHAKWHVRCDCGHTFTCLSQDLRRCGPCLMCGHKGPRPYRRKRPFESRFNALKGRGRHPVLITYEEFLKFTQVTECHYCGGSIDWELPYGHKGNSSATNLDRKDNSRPYEAENLVVCCRRCNYAKNTHFTYEEWTQLARVIRSWSIAQ